MRYNMMFIKIVIIIILYVTFLQISLNISQITTFDRKSQISFDFNCFSSIIKQLMVVLCYIVKAITRL